MDVAYNQHSNVARRKNRSSTNLNHLSLAPLTSRLPIHDQDDYDFNPISAPPHTTSYLQGKSAPTTPRLLSRSPGAGNAARLRSTSRPRTRGTSAPAARDPAALPKSKSATHLRAPGGTHLHGMSPTVSRRNGNGNGNGKTAHNDSDWLLRAGALISTETRESKGQAWLVSRASSTSLAGTPADADDDDDGLGVEEELGRDWVGAGATATATATSSAAASRRNSGVMLSEGNHHHHHYRHGYSPVHSRLGSRSHSRAMTPCERRLGVGVAVVGEEDYFGTSDGTPTAEDDAALIPGPDFVNLDEKLEAIEEQQLDVDGVDDEAYVRRLVKRGNSAGGLGSWIGSVFGVRLFSVEEDEEEEEDDESDGEDGDAAETGEGQTDDGAAGIAQDRRSSSLRRLQQLQVVPPAVDTTNIPPPKADEGGWHDAAWLLTVASKVLL